MSALAPSSSLAQPGTPADAAPLLELRDLSVRLPTAQGERLALDGVSLRLERGQTLGLIGESGCGKSMTALALMGLLPPGARVSGELLLAGAAGAVDGSAGRQNLLALDDAGWCRLRGARMGMVFQEPMSALNPLHTIARQVAEPLRLHRGLGAAAARAQALRLLDRVRLPQAAQRLDAYPHQLSGGQRQRVVLAIALACGPELLIADEPTTALDVSLQRELLALLADLVREDGMALLLISHDLGLMARQVQRLMVMYAGRVVEAGPAAALLAAPRHPYTRGLLAARPRLGLARGTRLPTIPGRVPELAGQRPPGCAFAPRCALAQADCGRLPPPWQTDVLQEPHREPLSEPGATGPAPASVEGAGWRCVLGPASAPLGEAAAKALPAGVGASPDQPWAEAAR